MKKQKFSNNKQQQNQQIQQQIDTNEQSIHSEQNEMKRLPICVGTYMGYAVYINRRDDVNILKPIERYKQNINIDKHYIIEVLI
jgi:hypothetical protein